MRLVDEAAGLAAIKHSGRRVVTAGMDRMTFMTPVLRRRAAALHRLGERGLADVDGGRRPGRGREPVHRRPDPSTAYLTMVALDDGPVAGAAAGSPRPGRAPAPARGRAAAGQPAGRARPDPRGPLAGGRGLRVRRSGATASSPAAIVPAMLTRSRPASLGVVEGGVDRSPRGRRSRAGSRSSEAATPQLISQPDAVRERMAGDGGADPFGEARRVSAGPRPGRDDQELLAADPVGELEGAELAADDVGDADEDVVAGTGGRRCR